MRVIPVRAHKGENAHLECLPKANIGVLHVCSLIRSQAKNMPLAEMSKATSDQYRVRVEGQQDLGR